MNDAIQAFPSDYWRWWLLSNAPETSDSDFTWKSFQSCINKDLADVLGNFVSRLVKFSKSKFGDHIPAGSGYSSLEKNTISETLKYFKAYEESMEMMEIRKSANLLRKIWSLGNEYLQISAPWTVVKENPEEAGKIVRLGFNLLNFYSDISKPFIPVTCQKIKSCLNVSYNEKEWPESNELFFSELKGGEKFFVIENLYSKIDDEKIAELQIKFGGN
tara:strand:- start:7 stop:657 length:651 start_codon:yes stop_codon:yes gene_type:complete